MKTIKDVLSPDKSLLTPADIEVLKDLVDEKKRAILMTIDSAKKDRRGDHHVAALDYGILVNVWNKLYAMRAAAK